ncbi:DUF4861 domain-containing protein [Cesiribacter sp. SM1]|uniref:DUF4861 domain-containing protein n=1 Tax=Cesiribacter sp. SM1 TaxID=2861196 RepID=UPI001CD74A3E|nr:DUF4861 domain-containing protein [Cesiribacter sp. SM1]
MKRNTQSFILLLLALQLFSCRQEHGSRRTFTVKNNLDMDRQQETVRVPAEKVSDLIESFGADNLLIKEEDSDSVLVSQAIDYDGDGRVDEILFQATIGANAEKRFVIQGVENGAAQRPESRLTTYSRFVPERIDDYTWENDRVAFRTYGPEAQRITESGKPGGTLTSGMDAWLKRVNYPVIDKWYANHQQSPGAYHIDTGEGYDPYHVGDSRGVGGIGVWENDSLYVSKNFSSYKTIATGPIRTVFELSYAPWVAAGRTVRETKRISLDLGSNLSHYEVFLDSEQALPNIAVGLTLHEGQGAVKASTEEGWFRYWEPMDDSELGVGLVIDPSVVQDYKERRVEAKDQSHILVLANPENNKLSYYAGFGWKKSGQFNSPQEWDQYLARFARQLEEPLMASF